VISLRADLSKYVLDPRLEYLKDCRRCGKLNPDRNPHAIQVVPGVGNLNAPALVLFEEPGETEAHFGFPVIGPSYIFIEWLESKFGFNFLQDFFLTNAIFCRAGDRKATKGELNNCRYNLDDIIRLMPNLKLIVTVGGIALRQIEGDSAVLSLRQGCLGRIKNYRFRNGEIRQEELYTLAFKHPAWLLRIQNEFGREAANQKYLAQLGLLKEVYKNLDNLNFTPPYDYTYCMSEEQAFDELNKLLTDPYIENIVWDFESGGIYRGWGEAVCLAASYKDYQAVVFPLRQYVMTDDGAIVRAKRGKKLHKLQGKLVPFFSDTFIPKFVETGRPLWQPIKQPTNRPRPFPSGWNVWFETRVFRNSLGIEFIPRPEQMNEFSVMNALLEKLNEARNLNLDVKCVQGIGEFIAKEGFGKIPPFDIMTAFRLATNELNSLALSKVLSWVMPLEADQKDPIEIELGKDSPTVQNEGFATMAIKCDYSFEEINRLGKLRFQKGVSQLTAVEREVIDRVWAEKAGVGKLETLFSRAAFDADAERRLIPRWQEMMQDGDSIMLRSALSGDIWLGEQPMGSGMNVYFGKE